MDRLRIIQQKDELLFPEIIFDKPINRLTQTKILLIGGSAERLKKISLCYESIIDSYSNVDLVLPDIIKDKLNVADVIYLSANPSGSFLKENSDNLIDLSTNYNLLIIGPDLHLGSEAHIMIEELLHHSTQPCIITDEMVKLLLLSPLILDQRKNLILFLDTNNLVKLANKLKIAVRIRQDQGVYNKAHLIREIANITNCPIICHDDTQIVSFDPMDKDVMGLINFDFSITESMGTIIGLIASFIANKNLTINKFIPKVLTACFLVKEALGKQMNIKVILDKYT